MAGLFRLVPIGDASYFERARPSRPWVRGGTEPPIP